MQALQQHQQLCDELHRLALEENSFLQQHRRVPDAAFLERKRGLLSRLEESLAALREVPARSVGSPALRTTLDKTRARILQILQLDRENEQLLLRYSLTGATGGSPAAPSASFLDKIYKQHA